MTGETWAADGEAERFVQRLADEAETYGRPREAVQRKHGAVIAFENERLRSRQILVIARTPLLLPANTRSFAVTQPLRRAAQAIAAMAMIPPWIISLRVRRGRDS
jgi:hypothetical protein